MGHGLTLPFGPIFAAGRWRRFRLVSFTDFIAWNLRAWNYYSHILVTCSNFRLERTIVVQHWKNKQGACLPKTCDNWWTKLARSKRLHIKHFKKKCTHRGWQKKLAVSPERERMKNCQSFCPLLSNLHALESCMNMGLGMLRSPVTCIRFMNNNKKEHSSSKKSIFQIRVEEEAEKEESDGRILDSASNELQMSSTSKENLISKTKKAKFSKDDDDNNSSILYADDIEYSCWKFDPYSWCAFVVYWCKSKCRLQ